MLANGWLTLKGQLRMSDSTTDSTKPQRCGKAGKLSRKVRLYDKALLYILLKHHKKQLGKMSSFSAPKVMFF